MRTEPIRWPTGSAYICPTVAYNDLDFVMYLETAQVGAYRLLLSDDGWESCCAAQYPDQKVDCWEAFRKGQWNLILCWNPEEYLRWLAATELAKVLNLTSKEERVGLFRVIRDGLDEPARALLERTRAIGEAKYLEFLNEH